MKYETTAWFKYLDLDENGQPYSTTEWKVTLKNGMVYKSFKWDKKYEDNEIQQTINNPKDTQT